MTFLLLVDVPLVLVASIQSQIEQRCTELGDRLIGRRVYDDTAEVLLVIQLMHTTHYTPHIKLLSPALQQRQILSFQSENTHMSLIQCDPSQQIRSHMCSFPLHANDSWFPAIADDHTAYFCTHRVLLKRDQERWIDEQHLHYQYL